MSLSFSKRLRGSLLAQSRKELSRREARDILGLVLTVAGRSGAGLITFISEQAEYVDYLVSAAQSARLPVHERKPSSKKMRCYSVGRTLTTMFAPAWRRLIL